MAFLAKLLGVDRIAAIAIAAIFAILAIGGLLGYIQSSAVTADRAKRAAQEAIQSQTRIQEMEQTDAQFRSLPEIERCRALARDSGLQPDACGAER
jgi:hypothetical protein